MLNSIVSSSSACVCLYLTMLILLLFICLRDPFYTRTKLKQPLNSYEYLAKLWASSYSETHRESEEVLWNALVHINVSVPYQVIVQHPH